jgi:hypothetical protein
MRDPSTTRRPAPASSSFQSILHWSSSSSGTPSSGPAHLPASGHSRPRWRSRRLATSHRWSIMNPSWELLWPENRRAAPTTQTPKPRSQGTAGINLPLHRPGLRHHLLFATEPGVRFWIQLPTTAIHHSVSDRHFHSHFLHSGETMVAKLVDVPLVLPLPCPVGCPAGGLTPVWISCLWVAYSCVWCGYGLSCDWVQFTKDNLIKKNWKGSQNAVFCIVVKKSTIFPLMSLCQDNLDYHVYFYFYDSL